MKELKQKLFDTLEEIYNSLTGNKKAIEIFFDYWNRISDENNGKKINEILDNFYLEFQKCKYNVDWKVLDKLEEFDFDF